MIKDHQDAYGHELYDYLHGEKVSEIIERDDGAIDLSGGPKAYFADHKSWLPFEKQAIRYVRGKVLDVGCGAGRHSLYLQQRGFDVVGIDVSPLAIEVCKLRGLKKAEVMSITQVASKLGRFDAILMLGANFGLFGSVAGAKRLLKRFSRMTGERARIVASSLDPYDTDEPIHLEYHEWNRQRGRMPGQVRLRVRHKKLKTPWFDYLFVSRNEMHEILSGTGWRVKNFIDSEGPTYAAIIEKGHRAGPRTAAANEGREPGC